MEERQSPDPLFKYSFQHGHVFYKPSHAQMLLQHVLESKHLRIGKFLPDFKKIKSFFLIAGTGLGKTVAMPVYLWLLGMNKQHTPSKNGPRVWVVEPKIAIAQGLCSEMSSDWQECMSREHIKPPSPFGCKTKVDHVNADAPIMFITTGIFSIYARKGMFKAGRDIILIDEAHETLEADTSVELAVGICRGSGIEIHYMSATVDTSDVEKQLGSQNVEIKGKRFPVWRHNMNQPLEACIEDIVEKALVQQDVNCELFPSFDYPFRSDILSAISEQHRTKGMLVIVNSFSGEHSDARKIEKILRNASFAHKIEIGLLASEILRDPHKRRRYHEMIENWKRKKSRYVLIATSVVEMGVTLPDLDYLVTMDSGFGEREACSLKHAPLGTNSLIQRLGRVGRLRPGIAYITQEIGAPYTELDDADLNHPDALTPEPICFPMGSGSLVWLAYETLSRKWKDEELSNKLKTEIRLATPIEESAERMAELIKERNTLKQIGAAGETGVTKEGKILERWIGRMNPACALGAHQALREGEALGVLQALCEGLVFEYPLEAICNAETVRENGKSDDWFYLSFVLQFGKLSTCRRRSWRVRTFAIEDPVDEMVMLEVRENALFRAFSLLHEFLDNFFEATRKDPVTASAEHVLSALRGYQKSIRAFLDLNVG